MTDDLRDRVLQAMWACMNLWESGFAHATHHVAAAVADGRLPADAFAGFPVGAPTHQVCQPIALAAGLVYATDQPIYDDDGYLVSVDGEDIDTAVGALIAIPHADACVHDDPDGGEWQFWDEDLERNGLTIDDVRGLWGALTLHEAAQLLAAVADVPNRGQQ